MRSETFAWLLPVWIIGAPLVVAIIDRMSTPKRGSALP